MTIKERHLILVVEMKPEEDKGIERNLILSSSKSDCSFSLDLTEGNCSRGFSDSQERYFIIIWILQV